MKKAISMLLVLVSCALLCLPLCGCSSENKTVTLTTENIDQYIAIVATYNNYRETSSYIVSGNYHGWCDIDLQAYATVPGAFSSVEITFLVDVPNKAGNPGEYPWYPAGGDKGNPVQFTFRLPTTGEYSHSYPIECDGVTTDLTADCEFTIVSVSGTFAPA